MYCTLCLVFFNRANIAICYRLLELALLCSEKTLTLYETQISPLYHLVVRFCEVVQAGDVFQKHTELCRQMFEHQVMVVSLLQLPHVFLGIE